VAQLGDQVTEAILPAAVRGVLETVDERCDAILLVEALGHDHLVGPLCRGEGMQVRLLCGLVQGEVADERPKGGLPKYPRHLPTHQTCPFQPCATGER
jgi:hypothetical protein